MSTALQKTNGGGKDFLRDLLAPLKLKQRTYLLYRICELDMKQSLAMTDITKSAYNTWCADELFVEVHRRLPQLQAYKQEAMQILRRKNQLNAILLEGMVIQKITDEVKAGRWNMAKTKLGTMVFDKLMNDLDIQPQVHLSWQDRLKELQDDSPLQGGNDVKVTVCKEDGSIEAEYQEGDLCEEDETPLDPMEEEVEEGIIVDEPSSTDQGSVTDRQ